MLVLSLGCLQCLHGARLLGHFGYMAWHRSLLTLLHRSLHESLFLSARLPLSLPPCPGGCQPSRGLPTKAVDDRRAAADDDGDGAEFCLRILIPNAFVGAVIGRGGATIRRLQWQAHTTIKCSTDVYPGTDDRIMTILSPSTAAIDAAQQLLLLRIAQSGADAFSEVTVVVPNDMVGRLIGHGGDNISEIRAVCPTTVSPLDPSGASDERLVTLTGDVVALTEGMRMVSFQRCNTVGCSNRNWFSENVSVVALA